jgi:hypothetical protein
LHIIGQIVYIFTVSFFSILDFEWRQGDKQKKLNRLAQWLKGHIMGHLADNRWKNDIILQCKIFNFWISKFLIQMCIYLLVCENQQLLFSNFLFYNQHSFTHCFTNILTGWAQWLKRHIIGNFAYYWTNSLYIYSVIFFNFLDFKVSYSNVHLFTSMWKSATFV